MRSWVRKDEEGQGGQEEGVLGRVLKIARGGQRNGIETQRMIGNTMVQRIVQGPKEAENIQRR